MLGALLDGELSGAEMLRVTGHIERCADCSDEFGGLRAVGDLLRTSALAVPSPAMPGLVDSVVTRVQAEEAQSWRGFLHRGVDDWHWVIVGLGSVTATFLVSLVAAAVLWFGPAPGRNDSLAAVLNGHGAGSAVFVVWNDSGDWDGMLERIASGGSATGHRPRGDMARAAFFGATEQELTGALSEAFTGQGHFVTLDAMSEGDRRYTEELLYQIQKIRVSTSQVLLMTNMTVNASGP
jgi:hypothetical protein